MYLYMLLQHHEVIKPEKLSFIGHCESILFSVSL